LSDSVNPRDYDIHLDPVPLVPIAERIVMEQDSMCVRVSFTLMNQPADGSTGRIGVFYRVADAKSAWIYHGSLRASPRPDYAFELFNLNEGVACDVGLCYEDVRGRESSVVAIYAAVAQPAQPGHDTIA
jgi:hypothetical protein